MSDKTLKILWDDQGWLKANVLWISQNYKKHDAVAIENNKIVHPQVNANGNYTLLFISNTCTAQKIKFSIKDLFSKCDQIRRKLRIWSHLLNKSLMENFIF